MITKILYTLLLIGLTLLLISHRSEKEAKNTELAKNQPEVETVSEQN